MISNMIQDNFTSDLFLMLQCKREDEETVASIYRNAIIENLKFRYGFSYNV